MDPTFYVCLNLKDNKNFVLSGKYDYVRHALKNSDNIGFPYTEDIFPEGKRRHEKSSAC